MDEREVDPPQIEEPTTPDATPPEKRALSPTAMAAIGIGAFLLILGFQAWMGARKVTAERRQMFARSVDALAATCDPLVLDKNYRSKASIIATKVSQSGDFDLVEIADRDGKIIGSTNRAREGQSPADLANPPLRAKVEVINGRLRATRAILLGSNNVIGTLRVELTEP